MAILIFEKSMADLEGGDGSIIMPSGFAAIMGVLLTFIEKNGHILITDNVYSPVRQACEQLLGKMGVEITYFNPQLGSKIKELIKPETKLIYCESPGSWTFEVSDIPAIAAVSNDFHIPLIVDNTWATPIFCNPLKLGADIVIHSASKYISGHSDLTLGSIISDQKNNRILKNQLFVSELSGAVSLYDCNLALRGLKTLSLRINLIQQNTLKIIDWLSSREEVEGILSPSIKTHPGHFFWKRDFTGSTGLFSITLKQDYYKKMNVFLHKLTIFKKGLGWGGTHSVIRTCDVSIVRDKSSLAQSLNLLRISIGIEPVDDLIADLTMAFDAMHKTKLNA